MPNDIVEEIMNEKEKYPVKNMEDEYVQGRPGSISLSDKSTLFGKLTDNSKKPKEIHNL